MSIPDGRARVDAAFETLWPVTVCDTDTEHAGSAYVTGATVAVRVLALVVCRLPAMVRVATGIACPAGGTECTPVGTVCTTVGTVCAVPGTVRTPSVTVRTLSDTVCTLTGVVRAVPVVVGRECATVLGVCNAAGALIWCVPNAGSVRRFARDFESAGVALAAVGGGSGAPDASSDSGRLNGSSGSNAKRADE